MDPFSRTTLGQTSVSVTRLGLGTGALAGTRRPVPAQTAETVLRHAHTRGIGLFDTAPLYGHGQAEWRAGKVLRTVPRESFTLATKVGRLLAPYETPGANQDYRDLPRDSGLDARGWVFDFSYDGVMRSVEESLRRLGLDRVDILHVHDPDAHGDAALAGAFKALNRLRSDGTIGAVGAGMNQAEMLVRFAQETDPDCFLLAGRYTLLDQAGLAALLPLCEARGIGIILGGVFNSGIIGNLDNPARATFNYLPAEAHWLEKARRIRAICAEFDVPIQAAALQFPFGHPAIAAVLTGAETTAELDENAANMQRPIPSGLWHALKSANLLHPEAPVPA
ncbi:MAG: aldo/keto reductase [Chloroflexi bacterium]|nr:aldo/keto reductase [Chloroflexota bacterium]